MCVRSGAGALCIFDAGNLCTFIFPFLSIASIFWDHPYFQRSPLLYMFSSRHSFSFIKFCYLYCFLLSIFFGFLSIFPSILRRKLRLLISLCSFLVYIFKAINYPTGIVFATSHECLYAVSSLCFSLKYFLVFIVIFLTHGLFGRIFS